MKNAIISVFLLLMLVLPIFSISASEGNSHLFQTNGCNPIFGRLDVPSPKWLKGADQMQINLSGIGFLQQNHLEYAQSFKPMKNTLTAVALHFFRLGIPHEQTKMTVSIKEELDGPELTAITVLANDWKIKTSGTWVLFNFPDIIVIPEHTYYIHEIISHGDYWGNTYGWSLQYEDQYLRGDAWFFLYPFWITLKQYWGWDPDDISDPDFCFITYYQEPKYKTLSHLFFMFLESHPNLFPILRILLE
jgi:hypothetical protein